MLRSLLNHLPSHKVWFISLLFWLLLNTLAAYHSYRWESYYGNDPVWLHTWLKSLPWWVNWAFVTPVVFAATRIISLKQKSIFRPLLANLGLLLVVFTLYWGMTIMEVALIKYGSINSFVLDQSVRELLLSPLHMDFLVYLAILGLGYGMSYYQESRQQVLDNEQLARQLAEIELHALKSQLDPHFLFNTLNTIAGLIRLDKKKDAVKALSELSLMLRKVLENQSNQFINLEQEMEFIHSYLAIQKMRFENKLLTDIRIDQDCYKFDIPFMLLQPLVENAVQHGSQLETDENCLTLTVNRCALHLNVVLVNKVTEQDEHKGFGIGLNNTRQRLKNLYADDFTLELTEIDGGYFKTFLSLPAGVNDD